MKLKYTKCSLALGKFLFSKQNLVALKMGDVLAGFSVFLGKRTAWMLDKTKHHPEQWPARL
jgi:hypothetical protein